MGTLKWIGTDLLKKLDARLTPNEQLALRIMIFVFVAIPPFVFWMSYAGLKTLWMASAWFVICATTFFFCITRISKRIRAGILCLAMLPLVALSGYKYKPFYDLDRKLKDARGHFEDEEYSWAFKDYEAVLTQAQSLGLQNYVFEADCNLGLSQRFLGQLPEAKERLWPCLTNAHLHPEYDSFNLAVANQALGHIYRVEGLEGEARLRDERAQEILEDLDRRKRLGASIYLADALRARAHLEFEFNNITGAQGWLLKAQSQLQQDGKGAALTPPLKQKRALVQAQISRLSGRLRTGLTRKLIVCGPVPSLSSVAPSVKATQEDDELAANDYEDALKAYKDLSHPKGMAQVLEGRGSLRMRTSPEDAAADFKEALINYRVAGDPFGEAKATFGLAQADRLLGSMELAKSEALQAAKAFDQLDASYFAADAYRELALVYRDTCDAGNANKSFQEAKRRYSSQHIALLPDCVQEASYRPLPDKCRLLAASINPTRFGSGKPQQPK